MTDFVSVEFGTIKAVTNDTEKTSMLSGTVTSETVAIPNAAGSSNETTAASAATQGEGVVRIYSPTKNWYWVAIGANPDANARAGRFLIGPGSPPEVRAVDNGHKVSIALAADL